MRDALSAAPPSFLPASMYTRVAQGFDCSSTNEKMRPCAQALIPIAASPTGQAWAIKLRQQGVHETKSNIEVWLPRTGGPIAN